MNKLRELVCLDCSVGGILSTFIVFCMCLKEGTEHHKLSKRQMHANQVEQNNSTSNTSIVFFKMITR